MLQTIVYTSRAILPEGASAADKPMWLDSLVARAISKNRERNISGVLSYKNGRIIQLIEGEPAQLQNLYTKILSDKRHTDVFILLDIKDSQRFFSKWGMVLEADIESSSLFRDFLHVNFDHLVEMTEQQSNEIMFFIDHIFYEIEKIQTNKYLN